MLYVDAPLFIFLIISGFVTIDIYHMIMVFIFVLAALKPKTFQRYVFQILLYADFYVMVKYVYSLTITQQQTNKQSWPALIGITSNFDPSSSREFFRYSFGAD